MARLWRTLAIAAPGVAALIVAVTGLVDGPAEGTPVAPSPLDALARLRALPPPVNAPGPEPLVAGVRRHVLVPRRLTGRGPFLTVSGPHAVMHPAPARRGMVALTFDDGPGPLTRAFLNRLDRLDAKATFFVVGYAVQRRPRLLRRIRAMGMGVGNHSWSHPPMRGMRPWRQRFQIATNERAIEHVLGYRPLFFRPPDLSFDLVTAREIAAAGLVGALYTVDTRDWMRPGVRRIVRRALTVRPGGVIAMHDGGGDRRQTLAALAPIVRGLRKRHLRPVTLDELYRPARSG